MTERPIIFSPPMVRAILAGAKTQTRRVVTPQPVGDDQLHLSGWDWSAGRCLFADGRGPVLPFVRCPYGVPGDRLWVRETHFRYGSWKVGPGYSARGEPRRVWLFTAAAPSASVPAVRFLDDTPREFRTRPAAALAWYVRPSLFLPRALSRILLEVVTVRVERVQAITEADAAAEGLPSRDRFADLWDRLNAKRGRSWAANPFCWVIAFRRVEPAEARAMA